MWLITLYITLLLLMIYSIRTYKESHLEQRHDFQILTLIPSFYRNIHQKWYIYIYL